HLSLHHRAQDLPTAADSDLPGTGTLRGHLLELVHGADVLALEVEDDVPALEPHDLGGAARGDVGDDDACGIIVEAQLVGKGGRQLFASSPGKTGLAVNRDLRAIEAPGTGERDGERLRCSVAQHRELGIATD